MDRSAQYKRAISTPSLDLLPFMNLLAILIPVLLISMEYLHVAAISAHIPIRSSTAAEVDEWTRITVIIDTKGFHMTREGTLTSGESLRESETIPRTSVDVLASGSGDFPEERLRIWRDQDKAFIYGSKPISADVLENRISDIHNRIKGIRRERALDWDFPALNRRLRELKPKARAPEVLLSAAPDIDYVAVIRTMDAIQSSIDANGTSEPLFPNVIMDTAAL